MYSAISSGMWLTRLFVSHFSPKNLIKNYYYEEFIAHGYIYVNIL